MGLAKHTQHSNNDVVGKDGGIDSSRFGEEYV
jgi:hypothetical protein